VIKNQILNLKNANFLAIIGILFLFSNCNNNEDPLLILDVDPSSLTTSFSVKDPILFYIRAQSTEVELSNFTTLIREESESTFTTKVDTSLSGNLFESIVTFDRPLDKDRKYFIQFIIRNKEGKEVKQLKTSIFRYDSTSVLLVESQGHRIYPKLTQEPDGFDILNRTRVYSDSALNSNSPIDIYEVPDTVIKLSNIWRSNTNGKFVRFNGFDYPNATLKSLTDAFESGEKLDQIVGFSENDIILFRSIERNIYAAIKIDEIEKGDSLTNPYYEFNLKK
jgi:hypothetical protein